jgi:hypothetical protein
LVRSETAGQETSHGTGRRRYNSTTSTRNPIRWTLYPFFDFYNCSPEETEEENRSRPTEKKKESTSNTITQHRGERLSSSS